MQPETMNWKRNWEVVALATRVALLALIYLSLAGCQSDSPPPAPTPTFIDRRQEVGEANVPLSDLIHGPEPAFDHLTVEQGLSQSTVSEIIQDSRGVMWFGTEDGLNQYDGYNFKVFRYNAGDANSLSNNHINALLDDGHGRLWIGTDGGGLNYLDLKSGRIGHYRAEEDGPGTISSDHVTAIATIPTRDGLWVGTSNGLDRFDQGKSQFQHFENPWPAVDDQFGSNFVTALQPDLAERLWVGTLAGLMKFNPDQGSFEPAPLLNSDVQPGISALTLDPDGSLWIGTFGEGLYRLGPGDDSAERYAADNLDVTSLSNNSPTSIAVDRSGAVWVGTTEGLELLDPASGEFQHIRSEPGRPDSLRSDTILSLAIDEAGILWLGTLDTGIEKYDPLKSKFNHIRSNAINPEAGLSHRMVWSVLEDSDNILWIGTESGLNRYDRQSGRFSHYFADPGSIHSLADDTVRAILEDSQGRLWLGTYGGLSRFDRQGESFSNYPHLPGIRSSLAHPAVLTLYEDREGSIWVGTADGLDRLESDSGIFSHYRAQEQGDPAQDQADNVFFTLLEDEAGRMWAGTMGGLAEVDKESGRLTYHRHDPDDETSLSQDEVLSLLEDSQGRFWVGTEDGLNLMDRATGRFTRFSELDGLPNDVIYGILEDDKGFLWISTNRGLVRYNPDNRSGQVFDTDDGVQSLEFNAGASHLGPSGEMYFGGINGLNAFRPANIKANPYRPPLIISDFQLLGGDREQSSTTLTDVSGLLELDREHTSFFFELAALHYASPENNQYAYILEGFDREWNYLGNRRFSTYTNLPPGDFTFRAIGSNSDGVWNEQGITLSVVVPYPYYRSTWFITLVTAIILAALASGYWWRSSNVARRTRELEVQVAARTAEIEQRRQIAEGLREILVILNSDRSLEESLHHIAAQAARLSEAEDTIMFRRDDNSSMEIVATNPGGQIRYSASAGLLAVTREWMASDLMEKQPLIISDLSSYWPAYPEVQLAGSIAHQALLGVPLFVGDKNYGGLIMFYSESRDFSEEDLELGLTFADQAALAIANDQLREQAERTAVASERSRLARDLHDAVTQTLFSASLIAETLPSIWEQNPAEGRQLLQELRQLTRGAQAEMRTLLLELRPAALEEADLVDLLKQLSEAVAGRTGIRVQADLKTPCELPINVRISLYRIAQESLNNVMKHARATEVDLLLDRCHDGEGAVLVISDDGRGFDIEGVTGEHLGLDIIRERAQLIGASLAINSSPGQGTLVRVEWKNGSSQ